MSILADSFDERPRVMAGDEEVVDGRDKRGHDEVGRFSDKRGHDGADAAPQVVAGAERDKRGRDDVRRCANYACIGLVAVLAGCAGLNDPFQREGTWNPEGSNEANLRATVANPAHLVTGASDSGSPAALSVAAINRLLSDQVKPLNGSGSSQTYQMSTMQSPAPTGAGK